MTKAMRLILSRGFCVGLILGGASSIAHAWEHEISRGLDLYRAASDGVVLSLVCDPNTVYGSGSESALRVQVGADDDYTGPLAIQFPDGKTVEADAQHGGVGKRFVSAKTWEQLLAGLRENTTLDLTINSVTHPVNTGKPADFTCE